MGIEKSVADKKGIELFELEKGKNLISTPNSNSNPNPNLKTSTTNGRGKKGKRRHQKKAVRVVSPVQKLYDTCKEAIAFGGTGVVPSPENVERLRAVIDDLNPTDFGLKPEMSHFRRTLSGKTPTIRYLHLFANDKFSMGIFCLPPSGVIPLHNHPGMTVFSKLLFGRMHIKSYDWVVGAPEATAFADSSGVKPHQSQQSGVRLAQVKVNSDFTAPCSAAILYPADGGNMHCFTAKTACAVLDVLVPPYSNVDGRHCTYYSDYPFTSFTAGGLSIPEEEREGYAWLHEREEPEGAAVLGEMFAGPIIVE